jgi:LacI family transcriptional regulator
LKIRIKDIADRAGVSTGTVDRVIHGRGEVSSKTRERVLDILNEMNYEPDLLARNLASRKPFRIAVLLPYHSPENWFWKEPISGIAEACREIDHFRIEVREFLYDQFRKEEFLRQGQGLLEYAPDIMIAAPVFHQETFDLFDRCKDAGIPFVSMNDNIRHPGQLTYVGQDPERSGAVAGNLMNTGLHGRGKILVASIAQDRDNYHHILLREKGFREYWSASKGKFSREILSRTFPRDSYTYIKQQLGKLFADHPDIRGIFVTNSRVYHVARFLHSSGRTDIMLVGYDLIKPNIEYLNNHTIDYLISQKPREQGYKALISAFNALRLNKKIPVEQLIPIDIICRENLCCYQV